MWHAHNRWDDAAVVFTSMKTAVGTILGKCKNEKCYLELTDS